MKHIYFIFISFCFVGIFSCHAQDIVISQIGNKELLLHKSSGVTELSDADSTMALGHGDNTLEYTKAYLYNNFPFYIQLFRNPAFDNLSHHKDFIETAYQGSGDLLVSKIESINEIEYYIAVDIRRDDYRGKIYVITARAYVDGQAFRVFTECLKEDYTQAYNAFIDILKKISLSN